MKVLLSVFWDPKDLGIRYIATWLRNKGHEVKIVALKNLNDMGPSSYKIDSKGVHQCIRVREGKTSPFIFNHITDKEIELYQEEVRKFAPEVIGFGTRSGPLAKIRDVVSAMRRAAPSAFIVAGGAGPTLTPEIPLEYGANAVIRGEGEYAIEELLACLEAGKDWHKIKNITYLDDEGRLQRNPMRPPQRDLDQFPFPSLEPYDDIAIDKNSIKPIIDPKDQDPLSYSSNYRYFILGSRGCPAACSYCGGRYLHDEYANDNILMPRFRMRSLDNIMRELVIAKEKLPMRMVQFCDEFFIRPVPDLIEFFKEYKKKIDVPFYAYLSHDQLAQSDEYFEAAVEAGFATCQIGLQSADRDFCANLYNRKNNMDNINKIIHKMYDAEVPVLILFILGNALQSEDSKRMNWDFLANLPYDPSFRKKIYPQFSKLYMPNYETTLFKRHFSSDILQSNEKFYYDAMMCCLSQICKMDQMERIDNDGKYHDQPWLLSELYLSTLKRRHQEYLLPELQRLNGNKAYFWGMGTAYHHLKNLTREISPVAMLNDFTWEKKNSIDGIPVIDPGNVELDTSHPLIIFARHDYVHAINRKAKNLGFEDIVVASFIE